MKQEIDKVLKEAQEKRAASPEETTPSPSEEVRRLHEDLSRLQERGYSYRHIDALRSVGGVMEWPDKTRVHKAKASLLRPGTCVVLLGPRGTGKTQLATELSLHGNRMLSGRYTTLSGLLQEEKDSWNHKPKLDSFNRPTSPLKVAKAKGLLVLDEIQEIRGTDWEHAQFVQAFDERYGAMRSTILIANLEPKAFEEFVGPSIWSRICETGLLVECDWEAYR